jgi:hypothetical protein
LFQALVPYAAPKLEILLLFWCWVILGVDALQKPEKLSGAHALKLLLPF